MDKYSNTKDSFWLKSGTLALAAIAGRVIGLLYRIPLTRILGDLGNNNYVCAFDIYYIVWLLSSFSLPLAVSKLIAEARVKGEDNYVREVLYAGFLYAAGLGLAASILMGILARTLTDTVLNTPNSIYALYSLVPALVIAALLGVLRGYFQGVGKMMQSAVSQVFEQVVNAFVSVFAAERLSAYAKTESLKAAYGAAGASLGTTIGGLASLCMLILFFVHEFRTALKGWKRIPWLDTKQMLLRIQATILPMLAASFFFSVNIALEQGMYKHLLADRLTADEIGMQWGVFSGKMKTILNFPIAVAAAIVAASMPEIAAAFSEKKEALAIKRSRDVWNATLRLSIFAVLMIIASSKAMPRLMFQDGTSLVWHLTCIGAPAILFYSWASVASGILQAAGHLKETVWHSAFALSLEAVSLYFLLKYTDLEIYGVLLTMTCFGLLAGILNQISCFRLFLKKRCVILVKKSKESWRHI